MSRAYAKESLGLTLNQFDGRGGNSINVESFENFEKGISEIEFGIKYEKENFHILKSEGIEKLKVDILNKAEEASEALQKSKDGGDLPKREDVINEGVELLKSFEAVKVENKDGIVETYFVKSKKVETPKDTEEAGK